MAERQPLAEALRAEILKLATEGDGKSEGAITPDVLLRVMRVAKTGRDLLVSLAASPSNLASMLRRPRFSPFGGNDNDEELLESPSVGVGQAIPYALSSPSENFGMTALREIVAAFKNMNGGPSPAKLGEALAIAKEKGLDDVTSALEAQLGIGKKEPAAKSELQSEGKEPQP